MQRPNYRSNFYTIFLTVVYFSVAVSHVFLMQRVSAHSHHQANSVFKRKTEEQNYVQRTDKVVLCIKGNVISRLIQKGSEVYTLAIYPINAIPNIPYPSYFFNKPPCYSYDLSAYHCSFKI
jgi:hypothetical protein